jgi:hypothetical protein
VPGQLLRGLRPDPGAFEHRDEGVPQGVKIGVQRPVRPVHDIRDARRRQVRLEHVRRPVRPRPRPHRHTGRLAAQVIIQGLHHFRRQGLRYRLAVLGVPGGQRRRRRYAVEVEGLGGEGREFARAEPGSARRQVEVEPVHAGQASEGRVAAPGGLQQPRHLGRREVAPVVAAVEADVPALQTRERVAVESVVIDQPAGELLDSLQPVVRRLDAPPLLFPQLGQEQLQPVGGQVGGEGEFATLQCRPNAGEFQGDVFLVAAVGAEARLPVRQVGRERPLAVFAEGVADAGLLHLDAPQ